MYSFAKKIAIAASLFALLGGDFVAFASHNDNDAAFPENTPAVAPANYNEPELMKSEPLSDQRLASASSVAPAMPEFASADAWRTHSVLEKLAGSLRYQPEGSAAIEVNLLTMHETNGDLVLPAELADLPLYVTRNISTFQSRADKEPGKILVALLQSSELKGVAQKLCENATFLKKVHNADVFRDAIVLMRNSKYPISTFGFRYTILEYREIRGLSLRQIYGHERADWPWADMGTMNFKGLLEFLPGGESLVNSLSFYVERKLFYIQDDQ
jgi:hypothetical protein